MASSSSSSSSSRVSEKHLVFLSFRGEDTRGNFTSHLYAALCSKGINTFIDDELRRGDEISQALLNAIEESMIAVIVFSKGYATSRWCLEELAKIIECKEARDLMVVPVFYQVDPSDVRYQKRTFEEAFVKHEEKQSSEKVMRWRNALKETANLSGFDSRNFRTEAELVKEIVKEILKKLNEMSPCENKDLVGIKSKIKKVELLLCLESKDVRISVGIWGMGGIGKTTLARAVFAKISHQFDSVYFQSNVRHCQIDVSQDLLAKILEDPCAILESTFTKSMLGSKKVLIVFDNVTDSEQIEKLIRRLENFGSGSRIILTSRDKQVLKNCGVSHGNIYQVKRLPFDEALILFSRHAFKLDHPPASHMELSKRVKEFAKGVPLALKVLGSSLFEKTSSDWESALVNLEKNPNPNPKIQDVLKISYDGLDNQEQRLFLDFACFLKGVHIKNALEILGFDSKIRVSNLSDKSLITTDSSRIEMHDLLQKMGQKIVELESEDPSKRSRLCHHHDIYNVLRSNTGTEAIECIYLNMYEIKEINLKCNAFLKMKRLRFLDFYHMDKNMLADSCDFYYCTCYSLGKFGDSPFRPELVCPYCSMAQKNVEKIHALEGLEFDSFYITYFRWFGYPLDSLPLNFELENLVALIMPGSKIKQLWNGVQHLEKLKHINLIHSKHLIRIPDLSKIPNLESLILEGCTSLIEIHPSIQYLNKLATLNLKNCKSLSSLPTHIQSKFLSELVLSGCSSLETAPTITSSMLIVLLGGTSIAELPLIEYPSNLYRLGLENCSRLESLPSEISQLKTLRRLDLTGCSNLHRFPDNFGQLDYLGELRANYTAIRELPHSILSLNNLRTLQLSGCRCQDLMDLGWLALSSLHRLDLSYCQITRLPDTLDQLFRLDHLNLSGNNFEQIPSSIKDCRSLRTLDISYCERLKFLPKLPPINELEAYNCTSLELYHDSELVGKLNLGNCFKLENARKILEVMYEDILVRLNLTGRYVLLPGNEIPEWLSFQSMGSSITIDQPNACCFQRYTVCIVVTFPDHDKTPESFSVRFKMIAEDQYGETKVMNLDSKLPKKFKCYNLVSDHVYLKYFYPYEYEKYAGKTKARKVTFDFRGENYIVKKCGVKCI